jgi:hypothetical protein
MALFTRLTHKDQPFPWGVEGNAFESLKASFMNTPLLINIVDLSKPFVLSNDAFNLALGAMLS